MEDTKLDNIPRMMSREMLKDLIDLIKPHKKDYPELYKYLMLTWTACHYNSTLIAGNITGLIMMQRHLSTFDDECIRFLQKEINSGTIEL